MWPKYSKTAPFHHRWRLVHQHPGGGICLCSEENDGQGAFFGFQRERKIIVAARSKERRLFDLRSTHSLHLHSLQSGREGGRKNQLVYIFINLRLYLTADEVHKINSFVHFNLVV